MIFFCDESVEAEVTEALRMAGHTAHSVLELAPSSPDRTVLGFAVKERAILITNDKDFGDLVIRQRLEHFGIVLLRCRRTTAREKASLLIGLINEHGGELAGKMVVVTPRSVRIRTVDQ